MCFVVDRETMIARESSLMWADGLAGWNYGERIAMLWGSDRDVKDAMSRGRAALRGWIENRRWYNAFDMGPARMAEFHQDMERFRPHIIVAYAGSIFLFARFLCERGLAPCYPLRGIISSAEMITPVMRTMVERVFQRPVFDRYGNREFGAVAAECGAHSGLHVNEADCLVEVGGADPFHADGPIRVTYLKNWAMPFIRYDTGDLGRILSDQPCGCGRETLRLAPVSGRQSDAIRTAAGKIIHGEYFTHLLYGAAGVREFQFIQEQPHAYCLRVVADTHDEAREGEWRRAILVAVGADAELRIEYVPAIPKLPSGKHKFTVSLVK